VVQNTEYKIVKWYIINFHVFILCSFNSKTFYILRKDNLWLILTYFDLLHFSIQVLNTNLKVQCLWQFEFGCVFYKLFYFRTKLVIYCNNYCIVYKWCDHVILFWKGSINKCFVFYNHIFFNFCYLLKKNIFFTAY